MIAAVLLSSFGLFDSVDIEATEDLLRFAIVVNVDDRWLFNWYIPELLESRGFKFLLFRVVTESENNRPLNFNSFTWRWRSWPTPVRQIDLVGAKLILSRAKYLFNQSFPTEPFCQIFWIFTMICQMFVGRKDSIRFGYSSLHRMLLQHRVLFSR